MMRSLHSNYLFNYYEDQTRIKDAWDLQEKRQQGECIPKYCKEPKLLQYKAATSLGTQLQRLYDVFPENQIKCILFDDFVGDTKNTYESVLTFLELNSDNKLHFKKTNSSKTHKIEFINKYLLNPPGVFRYMWKNIKNVFGNRVVNYLDKMILLNTRHMKPQGIDDELFNFFINEYDEEIKKISLIMNKDLSAWYANNK